MQTVSARTHLESLTSSIRFFADSLSAAQAQPARQVPACPGWGLPELYGHLGSVHRWITSALLVAGTSERFAPRQEWQQDSDAFEFFTASAPKMLAALAGIDPETPAWTFGPPPRTASFWFRRQNHEHLIHAEDLAQTLGLAAPKISDRFALDGVDEVLSVLIPQRIRAGLVEQPAPLRFVAGEASWSIGEGAAETVVETDPRTLFLGIWGRHALASQASVTGPVSHLEGFLAGNYVP
ncbi:conserved hypothetical protein [Renibacterium salmoninarum ATCC 33209]|uniref:Mycothiol-dependent maleylpyruvate isomerase metal-binding domain-containing protein n=1 Tax=Renibacterium salmoninarum (strain ATCC 33209 / DSM 20767 / JCM 11484 / NBRC 15589 / NCIMB 2235) TaxID=288705 RepID=A9WSA6_RENSM|nr:maleylpyruvate isomerase family mycothiol-dependent enzyme [Renibacterium salmoninarum]ABY23694.1 conserved hypothetical protein [Renibacterium salmoninarum ATCC 33209]